MTNIFKFKSFGDKNIIHGISTRYFGSMKTNNKVQVSNLQPFINALGIFSKKIVWVEQAHGNKIIMDNDIKKEKIICADGIITVKRGLPIVIFAADCLPVLIFEKKKKIIGAIHAGYRGILKGIIEKSIKKLVSLGGSPENVIIGIGPGIGSCCYDVEKMRVEKFIKRFPKFNNIYFEKNLEQHLNLNEIVKQEFLEFGVKEENIEVSNICTKCNLRDFYSYRGDSKKTFGEFVSVISIV